MGESTAPHFLVVDALEGLTLNDAIEEDCRKFTACNLGHRSFNKLFVDEVVKGVK